MKCSSIKLVSRQEVDGGSSRPFVRCHPLINGENNRYSFWRPKRRVNDRELPPKLAITNIILPDEFQVCSESRFKCWSRKNPKLKLQKSPQKKQDDWDLGVEEIQVKSMIDDKPVEEIEEEIDEDVQKLILEAYQKQNEFNETEEEEPENPKKEIEKLNKKKKKKTIRFTLSSPPSPKTQQVIRVDVRSNCSMANEEIFESDISSKESTNRQEERKKGPKVSDENFVIKSQKLILSTRET